MNSTDTAIAIITAGVAWLATIGTGGAVVFKLARQLRVAAPAKPPQAASGKDSGGEGSR